MKISTILPTMGIVLASFVLAACASKPADALMFTSAAMEKARSVEASEYAPKDWDRAQAQWQEANALIHMGDYTEARNVLTDATASFNDAEALANRSVESLKIEIKALQSSAATELKKIEQFSENPKLKPSVRRRLEAALPRIDERIAVMNAEFEAGKYMMARMDGQAVVRYMTELQEKFGLIR
jgi:hypothetical protein